MPSSYSQQFYVTDYRESTDTEVSTHIFFGSRSIDGLDAISLKSASPEVQNNFRQALQVRGVDLMSRTSGVLSGVHTEADIDQSLEAFDGAFRAMMDEGLISHD